MSTCNGTTTLQQGFSDPLIGAAGSGELEKVRRLVRKGHDVNYQECDDFEKADGRVVSIRGWTPIMIAAGNGHIEIVRFLAASGAKLDAKKSNGDTALLIAIRDENQAMATLLRELGATE
jgi:ankyrin repeat protein